MSDISQAAPIAADQRIQSIDTLRGFALLGILVMNIQSFAMIEAAYFDPSRHMDLDGVNWWVWAVSHALADSKFMSIFSMLFGAGIIVLTERREAAGQAVWGLHLRRNLWLLAFGLMHACLIWYGDILVTYALCALLVFWFRNFSVCWLLVLGGLVLCVAPLLGLLAGADIASAPAPIRDEIVRGFAPSKAHVVYEIAAYRSNWVDALRVRLMTLQGMYTEALPFYLVWRAGGLMLIGMALFKAGVLSASRSAAFYNRLILGGFIIGLPLVVLSVVQNAAAEWHPLFSLLGVGSLYNYVGSLGMAAAYIGVVMRLAQSGVWGAMQRRLAAVGRMAFTNYIAQSLICTFVFYGFGLGLFGSVERWGQVLIVLGVWALQLIISPLWLARYRFGPLEWLWRSLTYFKRQPMRR